MTKWITSKGTCINQVLTCSNPLIMSNGNNTIMVDTGRQRNWKNISNKLDKMLLGRSLSVLILTHTHHDHVENYMYLKEKYNVKTIMHKEEIEFLTKNGFYINLYPNEYYSFIDKKYNLNDYGFEAYVFHTPGHSNGSISIIIENEIAIIGDALNGIKKKPFAKKIKRVSKETLNSLEKLIGLNCSLYITSHGQALKHAEIQGLYEKYWDDINS